MRHVVRFVLAFILVSPALFAQSLTGSFSGIYTFTGTESCCANNRDRSFSGSITATFSQSGNSLFGLVVISGFKEINDQPGACGTRTCVIVDATIPAQINATVSGNTITGTIDVEEPPALPFSATISGNTVSGSLSFSEGSSSGTLNFTLTRVASNENVTGSWRGPYHFVDQLCSITSAGEVTATLMQSDGFVNGSATLTGVVNEEGTTCRPLPPLTVTTAIQGIVVGNRFEGALEAEEVSSVLSATIAGNQMSGTIRSTDEPGSGTFTLSRVSGPSGPVAPTIRSFAATPNSTRAGSSVSLSWVTENATGVSIDNGIGSQATSGAVMVTPAATTTYMLTASGAGGSATAQERVDVVQVADVRITLLPAGMIQAANTAGASTTYALSNAGGASTNITLNQNGDFFTQSPNTFTLGPGASQVVTITALARPAGAFGGASVPNGNGVPPGLSAPVTLLATEPPTGTARAVPAQNRIDVVGAPDVSPAGAAPFSNQGNARVVAIPSVDVPWLIVSSEPITIEPGATANVAFQIDRTKRPDFAAPLGSVSGILTLTYLTGTAAKLGALQGAATPTKSVVTVIDTARPQAAASGIPPLQPGEIAYIIPGVGHVRGSVGLFVSDVAILNHSASAGVSDLKLFYTRAGGDPANSFVAALPSLGQNKPLPVADIVNTTFQRDAEVGTLQVRTASTDKISVVANVFNSSNPAGTYGTVIPVFRSDRSVAPGGRIAITGLRRDPASHTNLFIQETTGFPATVKTDFHDPTGVVVNSRTDTVGAWGLIQLNNIVPAGAVSAIVTNLAESSGKIVSFATPVDDSPGGGDTWTLVDWRQLFGYSPAETTLVPVAGVVRGANNSFFRTDVALMNSGSTPATGTLRFHNQTGEVMNREISLPPLNTVVLNDVIGGAFGLPFGLGYLLYIPSTGAVAVTSRTYATVGNQPATFGTGVPTIATSTNLRLGQIQRIGSVEDAALPTIVALRPATFRTNFALVETSGEAVTVRVTMRFTYAQGKVEIPGSASKEYALGPRQFRLINNVARDVLGPGRDAEFGDLKNLQLDFEVTSGNGAVVVFISSVDNGTSDSTLRIE